MSEQTSAISHRYIGEINFYQYPPPLKLSRSEKKVVEKKLCLSTALNKTEKFTAFISIPFCRSHCYSCVYFNTILPMCPNKKSIVSSYVEAIERQIVAYHNTERFCQAECCALYIGGGTASVLADNTIATLVKKITKKYFAVSPDIEVTLEGNPLDFNKEYLARIFESGVNRISIGYQSCQDHILKDKIGSPHTGEDSAKSLKDALDIGFKTVNIDLLYGIPGQCLEDWIYDLLEATKLRPHSISIYPYIIYKNSFSERKIKNGELKEATSELKHQWYLYARRNLIQKGYFEHRKGNFAVPGHSQKYSEMTYRLCKESIAIGAGAYGFINGYLYKVTRNPKRLISNILSGDHFSVESLSMKADKKTMKEKYLMQNFVSGRISQSEFKATFGCFPDHSFHYIFERMKTEKLVEPEGDDIILTDLGRRWLNNVLYAFTNKAQQKYLLQR